MIILNNPTNSEILLTNKGVDINIPANADFAVTEEDARFVKETLGFITEVSKGTVEKEIPSVEEVIKEEVKEVEAPIVEEEVTPEAEETVEEVKEAPKAKAKK